jgi:hypothetical protein
MRSANNLALIRLSSLSLMSTRVLSGGERRGAQRANQPNQGEKNKLEIRLLTNQTISIRANSILITGQSFDNTESTCRLESRPRRVHPSHPIFIYTFDFYQLHCPSPNCATISKPILTDLSIVLITVGLACLPIPRSCICETDPSCVPHEAIRNNSQLSILFYSGAPVKSFTSALPG